MEGLGLEQIVITAYGALARFDLSYSERHSFTNASCQIPCTCWFCMHCNERCVCVSRNATQ